MKCCFRQCFQYNQVVSAVVVLDSRCSRQNGGWLVSLLQYQTRAHLLDSLGSWMKHVAEDKLQVHMETLGLQQFQEDLRPQRLALCRSLLQGLARAMGLPNPPNSCWTILSSTTEKIFSLLPNQIQVSASRTLHFYSSTDISTSVNVHTPADASVAFSPSGSITCVSSTWSDFPLLQLMNTLNIFMFVQVHVYSSYSAPTSTVCHLSITCFHLHTSTINYK